MLFVFRALRQKLSVSRSIYQRLLSPAAAPPHRIYKLISISLKALASSAKRQCFYKYLAKQCRFCYILVVQLVLKLDFIPALRRTIFYHLRSPPLPLEKLIMLILKPHPFIIMRLLRLSMKIYIIKF